MAELVGDPPDALARLERERCERMAAACSFSGRTPCLWARRRTRSHARPTLRSSEAVPDSEQNTHSGGYTKAPHLHLQVGKVAGEIEGYTIPIRFDDGSQQGLVPEQGQLYGPASEWRG